MAARMQRETAAILKATYKDAAGRFESTSQLSAIDKAVAAHSEKLRKVLAAGCARAASSFAERTADNARKSGNRPDVVKESALMRRVNQTIMNFIKQHVAKRVKEVDDTTKEHIKRAIERGREASASVAEIAREIRDTSGTISNTRAHVISRTETHTSANVGAMSAAEAFDTKIQKEWVSSGDDRTRDEHREAEQQGPIDMDETFTVGGEQLRFPGDPEGSPENIINCRCAVVFIG